LAYNVEIISFENIKKILTYDDNFIIHCQNNKIYMIKLRENDKFDKIEITTINENYEIIKLGDGFLILNNNLGITTIYYITYQKYVIIPTMN
jgi:hypothetical protein